MKRTAAITLLCMGAGAAAVASAFEGRCDPQSRAANEIPAVQADHANPKPQSCSSTRFAGHGGFFARVARGGFGSAGHGFGG
jgi:hypothetical protein